MLITRAGRLRVLKCRWFGLICRRPVELSDWLAPLIIMTLFARGDHVWAKYSGQMSEERNVDDVCLACLTWLYGLFVGTLIPLTNAYADCGRPVVNFIERFRLESVRLAFKWDTQR